MWAPSESACHLAAIHQQRTHTQEKVKAEYALMCSILEKLTAKINSNTFSTLPPDLS